MIVHESNQKTPPYILNEETNMKQESGSKRDPRIVGRLGEESIHTFKKVQPLSSFTYRRLDYASVPGNQHRHRVILVLIILAEFPKYVGQPRVADARTRFIMVGESTE